LKSIINKKVFVGIDVHKKNYFVTAVIENKIVKKDTVPGDPMYLLSYLKKHFKGNDCHSAYEAGFSGFTLHRTLVLNGIKNIVVHPASIEIASRERVKTDKRDSKKIAIQLASGRLKNIYIPAQKREDYRIISRLKETLVKEKTRKGVQLKSLLYQLGKIKFDDISKISKKWMTKILSLKFTEEQYFAVENLCEQWLSLITRIQKIEKELDKQAKKDSYLESFYRSAPGVGPTTARVLANELGDMKQFSNEKKLFSYTGLTPREYSSGEHRRLGHISRQGKPILRKMLVQAAWQAIKIDKKLNETYLKIKYRAGAKRAIIAIARKLIGHIRACIKNQCSYDLKDFTTT
jgi:transposase